MIALTFSCPSGPHAFRQIDAKAVEVIHNGSLMLWPILKADEGGGLSGMTRGARAIWGDEFWWKLTFGPPAKVEHRGDRVLARKDEEVPR